MTLRCRAACSGFKVHSRFAGLVGLALAAMLWNAHAAIPATGQNDPQTGLDGWDIYKFGMTPERVQEISGQRFKSLALPGLAPEPVFFLMGPEIDRYGLHFPSPMFQFDRERKLAAIFLRGDAGAMAPAQCTEAYATLLAMLDKEMGPFEPGEVNAILGSGSTKTEIHAVADTRSRFLDGMIENIPVPNVDPKTRLHFISALRRVGPKSIRVVAFSAEGPPLVGAPISQAVLDVDPHLALPTCTITISLQDRDVPAPTPSLGAGLLGGAPTASGAARPATVPSTIVRDAEKLLADAKRDGLMAPQDPIMEAYSLERARGEYKAADALIEKMTPSQKALAAYGRHDYPLALELWTPLARKGDVEAAASIASLYEYGLNGVTKDDAKAVEWRKVAANGGDSSSQGALGDAYAEGVGVPRDAVLAYMWMTAGLKQAQTGPWKNWYPASIAKKRDALVRRMKPDEIAKAQALAERCEARRFRNCQ